jgi:Ca2+-binding RTX toxin-like protein
MSQIRIERVPINNLQVTGFDHLQLAFEPTVTSPQWPQDEWFVIEGVFEPGPEGQILGVIGGDGSTTLPQANGGLTEQALVDQIGTPASRGSLVLSTGADPFSDWQVMAAYGADIDSQRLPYNAQLLASRTLANINSSSVVATLLSVIGVDIANNLPTGIGRTSGWTTYIGTSGDDSLTLENSFTTLVGGLGNDTLAGTDRDGIVERFYGGVGNDVFTWSEGSNVFHGGQLNLDYLADGIDVVDYTGVGNVSLELNPGRLANRAPDVLATHDSGTDYFLSIEQIRFNPLSDEVTFGAGLEGITDRIYLDFGDQAGLGQGDTINFTDSDDALTLIAGTDQDLIFVQGTSTQSDDAGLWLQSAEWIVGSSLDDTAYVNAAIRGFEGGDGNDIIDARLVDAFMPESPNGFDVEIYGGDGNDTIVSSEGLTYAEGGAGNDVFVLSDLTDPSATTVEFVIADAEAGDQLYVPYNFFSEPNGPFDDSSLLPLLGAMAQLPGEGGFANLPENEGPFTTPGPRSDFFAFTWQTEDDQFFNDDQTAGVIDFAGSILYNRDGDDLLIHLFSGSSLDVDATGSNGSTFTLTVNITDNSTETIIRIIDFQDGDLGIEFYDPGDTSIVSYTRDHGDYTALSFANWDNAVLAMTNGGNLGAPLPLRPDLPTYTPDDDLPPDPPTIIVGSVTDDVIMTPDGNHSVDAGDGDDSVTTGDGDDLLDGGAGSDELTGGTGDDTYLVDNSGDTVIEAANEGIDTIVSSVSYTLPDHVENLSLTNTPVGSTGTPAAALVTTLDGTGNSLRNYLSGSDDNNALVGLGGNDTLFGALGDDFLDGGQGSDTYLYFVGDGDDVIEDLGGVIDNDTLILDGISASDVSFYRVSSAPDDLIISIAQGGRLQVTSFFDASGESHGLERVRILGEADWSRTQIESIVAGVGILENEAPQAGDDDGLILRGPDAVIASADVLANDRDYDGDLLSITDVTSDNPNIIATVTAAGDIQLTGPASSETAATLTYTISDGQGGTASADVNVVLYPNRAPEAVGTIATQTILEDSTWLLTVDDALFTDPDGDTLTLSARLANGDPLPGWISFDAANRTFSATPPQDFNGDLTLQLSASDGGGSDSIDFTLSVTPVNDAPIAGDDADFETLENTDLIIGSAELLGNDIDVDGDALTVLSVTDAVNGSVVLNASGDALFTPDAGFTGAASFTYTVDDGNGGTDTGNVSLTVLTGPDDDILLGTPNNDRLVGTPEADIIDGLAGNDVLIGRGGADTFLGGAGADRMYGGSGRDTVDYSASSAAVAINLWSLGGQSGGMPRVIACSQLRR